MSEHDRMPRIAITMGDPCGVGPEVIAGALSDPEISRECFPVVIGEPLALRRACELIGVTIKVREIPSQQSIGESNGDEVPVYCPMHLEKQDIEPGKPTNRTARATISYIETAVSMTMQGITDAVCTGPINKAVLASSGFPFPGHTEFLQYLTGSDKAVMMLAGPSLRVSLVTIHVPLREVCSLLTVEGIIDTISITGKALAEFFGIDTPKIAVCGVNPHAGEGGKFGREEIEIIGKAVKEASDRLPFRISGPHPADTVFFHACQGYYDAVVAMYHDQGLLPIKLLHFHEAVNVTLGLPLIRTSVDHGTAYDIAGKGLAHWGSMKAAISLAAKMAGQKQRQREAARA